MRRQIDPQIALANAFMEHAIKVIDKGQSLWVRTENGWCHASRENSIPDMAATELEHCDYFYELRSMPKHEVRKLDKRRGFEVLPPKEVPL